jgi:hypothetical protein
MAKTVYTTEEIELQNGAVVTLRPLNIKGTRVFNEKFKEFSAPEFQGETGDETKAIEILVDLAAICLKRDLPELVADQDALEEALDIATIYKILEVCGGLDLKGMNAQLTASLLTE